jgi:transposase
VARPSGFSVEDKYRLVLAVISGEMSVAEAARRGKASEQSISNWKRLFLEMFPKFGPLAGGPGCRWGE